MKFPRLGRQISIWFSNFLATFMGFGFFLVYIGDLGQDFKVASFVLSRTEVTLRLVLEEGPFVSYLGRPSVSSI